jgi:hypothetical protein
MNAQTSGTRELAVCREPEAESFESLAIVIAV